jgi:hypothetical protein
VRAGARLGHQPSVFSGQRSLSGIEILPHEPDMYLNSADVRGSKQVVTDASGDTAYSPFGYGYAQSGSPALSFTGLNQDTATNLYDFMCRE